MLAQVARCHPHAATSDWCSILGWAPHPMNCPIFEFVYLTGGDEFFGSGSYNLYQHPRGLCRRVCECPASLLTNLEFTLAMD